MKKLLLTMTAALALLAGQGCEVIDPFLIALGLPLEASVDINGGNSWNESETYVIEDEVTEISDSYLEDIRAARVNDVTIFMVGAPASGTSSGSLSYALDGGLLLELATWTDVPFSALAEPGVSVLDSDVLTVNPVGLAALLSGLQSEDGLPAASSVTIQTDGTTSVNVAAGTRIVARIHYQLDVEI